MDAREPLRMSPPHSVGVVMSGNSYGAGMASNNPMSMPNSAGMSQGMRLPFSNIAAPASKPVDSTSLFHSDAVAEMGQGGMFSMSGDQAKKKRGRPRKYGPDGSMALALTPVSPGSGSNNPSADPSGKKRGRPLGSGKKQQLEALGSSGTGFTPHIITVKTGEDVASKIMAFSQQGLRTVCILSANGAINNVTLRQPATSGGTITYEGRFDIISLSGSFLVTEDGNTRSRTGGLSVALAGSDGRVFGGGVAGLLVAATPVQVVVASFIAEGKKAKAEPLKKELSSAPSAPTPINSMGATLTGSPLSEGMSGESSDEDDDSDSPINHDGGNYNQYNHHLHHPAFPPVSWPHSASHMRFDAEIRTTPH